MKQRIIAGFIIKPTGLIAPGEPIKAVVSLPEKAEPRDVMIDVRGQMVLFAEVWSHPEGTEVRHVDFDLVLTVTAQVVPPGSWEYWKTISHGPAIFHVFVKPKGSILKPV